MSPSFNLINKRNVLSISYALMCLMFFTGCQSKRKKNKNSRQPYYNEQNTYYDILHPDEIYKLPERVAEISGLTFSENEDQLLFLDDESGKMFIYDLGKKRIKTSMRFWKNADFEGIERIDDQVFALKSDGDLVSFKYEDNHIMTGKREGTVLSNKNDTEGLGYDQEKDVLLIACKNVGDIKNKEVPGRVVYGYDYKTGTLSEDPVIQIRWEQVREFLEYKGGDAYLKDSKKFRPSGIALHPIEKNYYVLSSTGKSILVFNREEAIIGYYTVPRKIFEQPEGICFNSKGDLFISSEGDERKARIAKFVLKSK